MISSCDVGSIIYPRQEGLFLPNLDSGRLSTLNLFVTNWRLLMGKGEGRSTWGREIRFCRSYVICKYWVQLKTLGTQLEYIIGWLRKLTPRLNIHISSSGGVQGVGGGGWGRLLQRFWWHHQPAVKGLWQMHIAPLLGKLLLTNAKLQRIDKYRWQIKLTNTDEHFPFNIVTF